MAVTVVSGVTAEGLNNPIFTGTGSATLPVGTTGQRPSPGSEGMIRFNSTTGLFEGYNGTSWSPFASAGAGITAINSQTGPSITLIAGTTGTDVNIDSTSNVLTVNVPDAGASARGVVNTTTQTFAGVKTFTSDLNVTSTGAVLVSSGTTGQRPGTPAVGMIRYNTTTNALEAYISGTWQSLQAAGSGVLSLNGLTGALTLSSGTAGSDFNITSVGTAITLNLPDAATTARGVMTTGIQAFAGAKTFISDLTVSSTGFVQIASGTTVQRPGSPASGMLRFNTTLGVYEGYNGSTWVTLASINAAPANVIYVATNGDDTNGDGTYYKPYATVSKANSVITTASTSNRYVVYLLGGLYTETTMVMKPWVYYTGLTTVATRLTVTSNQITADPSFGSGNARGGLLNISLVGSTSLVLDYSAMASASAVIDVYNVNMNGGITVKGRSLGADFLQAENIVALGNLSLSNCQGYLINTVFGGNVNFDTAATTGNLTFDVQALTCSGTATVTSSGSATSLVNFTASRFDSTLTISATGTTVTADVVSIPASSNVTISGGATLTRRSTAYGLGYTPATSGNWSTVPSQVNTALDDLASSGIFKSQSANTVLAAPNGSAGLPSFRALSAADIPSLQFDSVRYIDFNNGSDVTGDGSQQRPWQSLQHAFNSVTPTINVPVYFYLVGGFDSADTTVITGKPNVYIIGNGCSIPQELVISGGSTNDVVTVRDVIFSGATAFNWTRNDATEISLGFINVECFGPTFFKQQGSGVAASLFTAYDSFLGDLTLNAGESSLGDTDVFGTITYLDSGSAVFQAFGGSLGGAVTLNGGLTAQFAGVYSGAGYTLTTVTTGSGTPAISTDASSIPASITGPGTVTSISNSQYENYTPANSSHWSPVVPTRVNQALDILAADNASAGAQILSNTVATPLTGGTVNIPNNVAVQVLNPAGTLASLTVNLPSSGLTNGQVVTITTSQQITSLTLGGGTIVSPAASLPLGGVARYIYLTSTSTWYPL